MQLLMVCYLLYFFLFHWSTLNLLDQEALRPPSPSLEYDNFGIPDDVLMTIDLENLETHNNGKFFKYKYILIDKY